MLLQIKDHLRHTTVLCRPGSFHHLLFFPKKLQINKNTLSPVLHLRQEPLQWNRCPVRAVNPYKLGLSSRFSGGNRRSSLPLFQNLKNFLQDLFCRLILKDQWTCLSTLCHAVALRHDHKMSRPVKVFYPGPVDILSQKQNIRLPVLQKFIQTLELCKQSAV